MAIQATFTADTRPLEQGLERAASSIAKAKRAGEDTGRALKAMGSSFDGTKTEGTALRLAASVQKIGGAVRLTDAEWKRADRTVADVLQKYERMGTVAPAAIQALRRELDQVRTSATQANSALSGISGAGGGGLGSRLSSALGIGVGAGLGLGAVAGIASSVREMAAAGQQLTPLANAFEKLQGSPERAAQSLDTMKAATRGLVSELDLLQAANKAQLLGITDLGVDLGDLASVATTLGRAMGQDAGKSVDDLTTALGRMSPQILDNLGITVKVEEANERYAASLGKTVEALTDQEKKLAFIQAAMEAAREKASLLGDAQLTVGDQIQRATTLFTDHLTRLAAAGNSSGVLSEATGFLVDQYEALFKAGSDVSRTFRNITGDIGAQTPIIDEHTSALERLTKAAGDFAREQVKFGAAAIVAPGATAAAGLLRTAGRTLDIARAGQVAGQFAAGGPALPGIHHGDIVLGESLWDKWRKGAQARADEEARVVAATQAKADQMAEQAAQRRAADLAKWRQELEKLTGQQILSDAERLATQLGEIREAGEQVPASAVGQLADQLMRARDMAQQTGRAIGQSVTAELEQLVRSPAYRELFQAGLRNPQIGLGERGSLSAITGTGLEFALSGGLPASTLPDDFNTFTAGRLLGLSAITVDLQAGLPALRDWRLGVRELAQSFGTLAQVAGPAFDGASRTMGTMVAAASLGVDLTKSLSTFLSGLVDDQGNQTNAGRAVSGGIAGLTTGLQIGGLIPQSRWGAVAAGIGGGAVSGGLATGWNPVGIGVGAVVGGIGAALASGARARALNQAKDVQAEQLVAQFGTLDNLLDTVGALGLSQQSFLERFYGDPEAFASGVSELNAALTNEQRIVDSLARSLKAAADAQGILSREDLSTLGNLRADGPGGEMATQFLQGQTSQLIAGLTQAAQSGVLSSAGQQGVGLGLGAAFAALREQGVSAVVALRQLEPAIAALTKAGGGTSVAGLQSLLDILNDADLGPFIDAAYGSSAAIAALTNTGLITQEMFDGLSASILDAYNALVADGRGEEALRLMQGPLQNLWQMMTDFGLTVDEGTQALIDMAVDAGIVGDRFRPATDRMVTALDRFIERMDVLLGQFAALSGVTWPQPPTGAGVGPGDEPPMDTPGAPSPNGGDYTAHATLGVNPTAPSGGSTTITVISQLDGREIARSTNRYQGDERRLVGVA